MSHPCAECPWRKDVVPGKFPPERFEKLAETCEEGGLHPVFACHMTPEGEEKACAGMILVVGADLNAVRLAMCTGRVNPVTILTKAPLYASYAEMAAANGYVLPPRREEHEIFLEKLRTTGALHDFTAR
jgi:hypothetical protein